MDSDGLRIRCFFTITKMKNMYITCEELERLEACNSREDWSHACDAIKSVRGQMYPDDWWEKVVESGLGDRVTSRWGGSSSLTVATFSNLREVT